MERAESFAEGPATFHGDVERALAETDAEISRLRAELARAEERRTGLSAWRSVSRDSARAAEQHVAESRAAVTAEQERAQAAQTASSRQQAERLRAQLLGAA